MIFPGDGWRAGRAGSRMGRGPPASLYPANPPSLACSCSLFIFNGGYWARVWAGTPGTEAPAAGGLTNGGERVSGGGEGGSQPTRGWPRAGSVQFGAAAGRQAAGTASLAAFTGPHWPPVLGPPEPQSPRRRGRGLRHSWVPPSPWLRRCQPPLELVTAGAY